MKGYIYITGAGADPGDGAPLSDPVFKGIPSLGACMPNIRRAVFPGDWIFVVTAKRPAVQQYVLGGMQVKEKLDAIAAYKRFPENRLRVGPNGDVEGNIIVNSRGIQHPLDHHPKSTFQERIKNFVVGTNPINLETPKEVAIGRIQTLPKLSQLLGKRGNRVIDVIARNSKLSEAQVDDLVSWLRGIKEIAAKP